MLILVATFPSDPTPLPTPLVTASKWHSQNHAILVATFPSDPTPLMTASKWYSQNHAHPGGNFSF